MQLTDDMQRVVREQSLGFVATVRPDGTPALSPKGTTSVWDAGHLVFLHLHSPHTVDNLRHNPNVEINVVDPIVRKGYRFTGLGRVVDGGPEYEQILDWFTAQRGGDYRAKVKAAVLVAITGAEALTSPAYDDGSTEADVSARWRQRHLGLDAGATGAAPG
jgi:predicted pyridoxine 5'-phosphate oxidase superfamily flavin-nucleotide-binding protein